MSFSIWPAAQNQDYGAHTLPPPASTNWTPAWQGSVSNPTCTYTSQLGYYQRFGNVVFVTGVIVISAVSGGSGTLRIGGLPFTVGSNEAQRGGFNIVFTANFGATTAPQAIIPVAGQTYCELSRRASTDARDNISGFLAVGDLTATANIYFNGFYFV